MVGEGDQYEAGHKHTVSHAHKHAQDKNYTDDTHLQFRHCVHHIAFSRRLSLLPFRSIRANEATLTHGEEVGIHRPGHHLLGVVQLATHILGNEVQRELGVREFGELESARAIAGQRAQHLPVHAIAHNTGDHPRGALDERLQARCELSFAGNLGKLYVIIEAIERNRCQ